MTNTLTISREQIEAVAKEMDRLGYGHHEHHAESILHAIIAAPVVERQEPKGALIRSREYVGIGQGGRELWHDWTEWVNTTVAHAQSKIEQTKDLSSIQFEVEWLYTSPPAPVAVPDGWKLVPIVPTMHMLEALMEWNNVGNVNAYNSILDSAPAFIDKVKEMNQ